MRRAARAGVLLCAFTSLLVGACGEDGPTEAAPLNATSLAKAPAREKRWPGGYPAPLFLPKARPQTATRLTLASAMAVSFRSVAFSSFSVGSSTPAQSGRPSCRAHAIRVPYRAIS